MTRGLFLSLDGIDGTGKSTQCRMLAEWLRSLGRTVTECSDPGSTEIGRVLRGLVLEHRGDVALRCEALLFMASRAQLVAEVVRPALDAGHVVLSDRFSLANVVYQGRAGGLEVGRLWDVADFATGGLEPDFTIVLDLPPDVAAARRNRPADRVERRGPEYHVRVREGFLAEARRRPDRIRVVNAGGTVEAVQALIRTEVANVLEAHPRA